jgi:aminopeptidase N
MEYPMTVFVQAFDDVFAMDGVSAHEIGHEWFPMLVGSNETRYGWLDEGLTTYSTFFATDAFFPDSMRGRGLKQSQEGYLGFAANADEDLQMMSPANSFGVWQAGYGIEAYAKPATVLWELRATLGPETFDPAFREYVRRWSYLHPSPWDFFQTIEDVTGKDLDAFWYSWFFTRQRLDQSIAHVELQGDQLAVTVRNDGQVYAPIVVTATTAEGETVAWTEPMDAWYDGRETVTTSHAVSGRVVKVELDAARDFLDVDRDDNVWTAE